MPTFLNFAFGSYVVMVRLILVKSQSDLQLVYTGIALSVALVKICPLATGENLAISLLNICTKKAISF